MIAHVLIARRAMQAIGNEVRRARARDGLSVRQLSDLIGVRHDVITRVESGRWIPTDDEADRLSRWLAGEPA